MNSIAGFFISGWYVFDNFAPFQIEWRGKLYPTSEHAYQAAHFIDNSPELAEKVRLCRSPRLASDYANAQGEHDNPKWSQKKIDIMEDIIRCKLEQHSYIKEILLASDGLDIVEMNDEDGFWGWGIEHNGRN